jgi:hypothetical protein
MAALSAFSDSEQQTLRFGPLWVFQVIAGADHDWDENESAALQTWIKENAPSKSEVTKASFMANVDDFEANMKKFAGDSRKAGDGLREVKALLEGKAADEAAEFKAAMMDLGKHVASVSDAVSDTEQQVLDKMQEILGA